ncbi:MAG: DUF6152 family protein [Alphaproteobacteria bacterium]|jgi:hypothetical protein
MKTFMTFLAAAAITVTAVPTMAHHNANAQYDNSKEFSVLGTLTEFRDIAPHAQWRVTSVDPATKAQKAWAFEALGANGLRRMGVAVKTDFKVGQSYTFFYTPARDGSNSGFITAVVINGKKYQMVRL